jgi:hypothetical protein
MGLLGRLWQGSESLAPARGAFGGAPRASDAWRRERHDWHEALKALTVITVSLGSVRQHTSGKTKGPDVGQKMGLIMRLMPGAKMGEPEGSVMPTLILWTVLWMLLRGATWAAESTAGLIHRSLPCVRIRAG